MLAHGILAQSQYAAEVAAASPWVTDGLIGYWDANNSTSYGGSGTTWTDLSSTAANLSYQSSISYTAGTRGLPSYFAIDSTADGNAYFTVTNSALGEVANNTGMTIQALVYVTTWGTPSVSYIAGNDSNSNGAWRLKAQVLGGSNKFALQPWDVVDNAFNIVDAGGNSNGTWYFVTATNDWSAGQGEASINDGSMTTTATSTSTPNGSHSTFTVGKAPSLSDLFKGRISAVMVYDKVLSSAEITQNYEYVTGQYAPADGLPVGGYDFWFDFADASTITESGGIISSMTDKDGLYTLTPRGGYNAVYDAANKRLDGQNSTNGYYLADNGTAIQAIFNSRNLASNDYTLVSIVSESPSRNFPIGLRTEGNKRWDIFFNDSTGRRDIVYGGQTFVSGITNDNTKTTVLFSQIAGGNRTIYRWGTSESSGGPGSVGSVATDADAFRIGATARNTLTPAPSFTGYTYAHILYPKTLTSQERSDIVTWAQTYYGITLQA